MEMRRAESVTTVGARGAGMDTADSGRALGGWACWAEVGRVVSWGVPEGYVQVQ